MPSVTVVSFYGHQHSAVQIAVKKVQLDNSAVPSLVQFVLIEQVINGQLVGGGYRYIHDTTLYALAADLM